MIQANALKFYATAHFPTTLRADGPLGLFIGNIASGSETPVITARPLVLLQKGLKFGSTTTIERRVSTFSESPIEAYISDSSLSA